MSSLVEVDFVFEIFRLVLISEETYFVWQNKDSSVGKTEYFWCGKNEILYGEDDH